jgi:hypothetical protein
MNGDFVPAAAIVLRKEPKYPLIRNLGWARNNLLLVLSWNGPRLFIGSETTVRKMMIKLTIVLAVIVVVVVVVVIIIITQFCVYADKFALPLEDYAMLMVLKQHVRLEIDSLDIN